VIELQARNISNFILKNSPEKGLFYINLYSEGTANPKLIKDPHTVKGGDGFNRPR